MAALVDELVATLTLGAARAPQWWHERWSRSWWWTLLLTPIVTLWSGAIKDLHSDYLVFILQTQNNPSQQVLPRSFYWPQLLLSWSWSLDMTARLNSVLRVAGWLFCAIWFGRLVAVATSAKWWKIGTTVFAVAVGWSMWWPEVGDSLIYSGSSLGVFMFLAVLGDPSRLAVKRVNQPWFAAAICVVAFTVTSTNVLSWLVLLPIVTWILLFGTTESVQRRLAAGFAIALGVVVGIARLRNFASEDTGVTTFGLITRIRTTRHLWDGTLYLWDNLRIAGIVAVVSVLLAWRLHRVKLAALALAGFLVSLGVVPTAALSHVQANAMMPRYFAVQISFGLLVQCLVMAALTVDLFEKRHYCAAPMRLPAKFARGSRAAMVVASVMSIVVLAIAPLSFGLDYRDQSGRRKMGLPLSNETIKWVKELSRAEGVSILVAIDFWDNYPTQYVMQEQGIETFVFDGTRPVFDRFQPNFRQFLSLKSFVAVCRPKAQTCALDLIIGLKNRHLTDFEVVSLGKMVEPGDGTIETLRVRPKQTDA